MQENKTVLFTREHKTLYAQGDKVIKVFDSNYKKSDVLNEARNEALVQENSDLNVPSLSSVSESEEGWCLIRDKVEGVTLAELMQQHPEKMEEYMELFVDLQLQVHKQRVPSIKTLRHKLMDQISKYFLCLSGDHLDSLSNCRSLRCGVQIFRPQAKLFSGLKYICEKLFRYENGIYREAFRLFFCELTQIYLCKILS